MEDSLQQRVWQLEHVVAELNKSLIYWRRVYDGTQLEAGVREWVSSRLGKDHNSPQERAMRLLEEVVELAQSEGIPLELVTEQVKHVYGRPWGTPEGEAPGVAVCLYGYCASRGMQLTEIAQRELERIQSLPQESIQKSLQRKVDAGLLTAGLTHAPEME